jgi:hypothetical protein
MENYGGICRHGKTPDSSTKVLWQLYQQSHLVANQENLGERNDGFSVLV